MGRALTLWLAAAATPGFPAWLFGPDRLAAGIRDAWPRELRSDARP